MSPHPHPDLNHIPPPTPNLSHPPMIYNNSTMDLEFLVQKRQSNKCKSVRNDEIFNLHLASGMGPWVRIFCLLQDTSYICWFHPPKQLTRKKQRTQKWDSTPNKSYRAALEHNADPWLREVDLEQALREAVTRSTCWKKEERLKKKTSLIIQPGPMSGSKDLER